MGVFFLFELHTLNDEKLFALIKYDNEDVVRYVLDAEGNEFQVPRLERFRESFVKKAEAMQKIALVRLTADAFCDVLNSMRHLNGACSASRP
ncbi:TPA: hypothetical protein MJA52_001916 [Klebsiella aerogenes]|nr:hypothetical protein [Klebsiella aerogenes]